MRHEDWVTRLDNYITSHQGQTFSYDHAVGMDCCSWVFGAIQAVCGIDIGQSFRGRYRTRREARTLMGQYCGKPSLTPFIEKLMAEHGFPEVSPLLAGRGDVVLLPTKQRTFGILDLNGSSVLSMGDGIMRVPLTVSCRAWRI